MSFVYVHRNYYYLLRVRTLDFRNQNEIKEFHSHFLTEVSTLIHLFGLLGKLLSHFDCFFKTCQMCDSGDGDKKPTISRPT
jgi:hypothetical protein